MPRRHQADVVTAVAVRGDLVILVTDRGELESAKSESGICEVEGGGKLATIVAEGTRVKKGDVVARFDTDILQKAINEQEVKWQQAVGKRKAAESDLEVQKNKEQGEVAKAELDLDLAKIDLEAYDDPQGQYKAELEKLKAALEMAKKEEKEAEDSLKFTQGLIKKGLGQREQERSMAMNLAGKQNTAREKAADLSVFQRFTRKRKLTELRGKAADADRNLIRTRKSQQAATEKATTDLQAAVRTAELEEKQLARLKKQLDKCEVKAPQDGILIYSKQRYWDESSRIRPGATLYFQQQIFTLPDLNNMQVKLRVHESVVKKVQKGMTATMQIDALPNQVLHGRVLSVATLAQQDGWGRGGVKEYETVVSIDDLPRDAGLRPGMTAEVKILVKTIHEALTVPVQAVTESDGKYVCYVVTPKGVERREVTIGEGNEQLVQVLDGLGEGEAVALDARVRPAAEVKAGVADKGKHDAKAEKAPAPASPGKPGG
jgi:RND family efflux transporter MFP subunit